MQKAAEWFYRENLGIVYRESKLLREEAFDAYSDALTAFIDNIRNGVFRGESKCSTYFIRIFNNKCIDIFRKKTTNKAKQVTMSIDEIKMDVPETVSEERDDHIADITSWFNELSEVCRDVLMDWSDGYSMEEIAERNGLKNAHTARSKRYNCFHQLMEILQKRKILQSNPNTL